MKPLKLTLIALLLLFVSNVSYGQIAGITGPAQYCDGFPGTLTDATGGGTWTCSMPAIATVGALTGIVTGIAPGTATITYTVGPSYVTYAITINPLPAPISGAPFVCLGSMTTLSDGTPGGTWSSSVLAVGTIDPATAVFTGVSAGITTVTYAIPATGCATSIAVTVNPVPTAISGPTSVCTGGTITLSSSGGGLWSSHNVGVASVGSSSGIVTGNTPGSTIIDYTLGTGCSSSTSITVVPSTVTLYALTGGGNYCAGGAGVAVGLSGSQAGVSYQLYNGVTVVGSPVTGTGSAISFGLMTAAGTYTVVANPGSTCATTMTGGATVTISPLPVSYTLGGGGGYCTGGPGVHIILSNSNVGINYQLFLGGTVIGPIIAGTGSSLDFGLMTIAGTYTAYGSDATTTCMNTMTGAVTITINPLPTVYTVTGGGSYCAGGAGVLVGLSNSGLGIDYQLYNGSSPVGAPVIGTGSAISFGLQTAAGSYTVIATDAVTGCSNTMTGSVTVTITPISTPSVSITASPGTTICAGATATFTVTPTSGGTTPTYQWTLNGVDIPGATNTTYSTTTLITGDIVGVTMTSSAPCVLSPTTSTSVTMTIDVPTVTATATTATCGAVVTLTAGGASTYSWAPSTGLSCTSCGTATTTPASTVTYTVTGTDSYGCTNTATATVNGNNITGHITYTGVSTDVFTVWLIQFNPSDSSIAALDSAYSCMDAGVPYYGFTSPAAGNYLVKAKLNSAVPGTSGYIPTYSTSTPNWYLGTSLTHASSADVMDITMVYGTVPTGPGFISGYVYSGAGKGTTGDIPEPGMLVYLKDGSGAIVTYTYTDVTGLYSFPSLANGSYIIYPEDYKYYTTPSAVITLSPTAEIAGSIDFKKHTTFGTITPNTASILNVAANTGQGFYPNPTNGILNVALGAHATEAADVVVTSITGSIVYKSVINIDAKQAQTQIDLSALTDGMYFLNLRSGDINYSGKLLIVK